MQRFYLKQRLDRSLPLTFYRQLSPPCVPAAPSVRRFAREIGINIAHRPDLTLYPVTSLADQGVSISPPEFFAHLFVEMSEALYVWDEGRGIAEIVRRWRRVACGIGEKITVNLPDRSISGIFSGIDDKGILLLDRGSDGMMSVAAGDVFFG